MAEKLVWRGGDRWERVRDRRWEEACGGGKSAGELGWPVIWRLGRRRW
jgi:hypothetical protein